MKSKGIMPIGTSDFRELFRDGSYYIDKTYAIKELLELTFPTPNLKSNILDKSYI